MPTFHAYAEQWWVRNEGWFADKTREDYKWRLERNLLPYFGEHALDRITFDTVEKYIAAKLDEDKPLSARSINMTLVLLSSILETAVERELIDRNPASGQRRRVRERGPRRTQVDTADAIGALLAAAGELDGKRRGRYRRALLATLLFAGLRVSELCGLRWRDVDLATGWLTAEDSKTDAGRRRVKLRGRLGTSSRRSNPSTPTRTATCSARAPAAHRTPRTSATGSWPRRSTVRPNVSREQEGHRSRT